MKYCNWCFLNFLQAYDEWPQFRQPLAKEKEGERRLGEAGKFRDRGGGRESPEREGTRHKWEKYNEQTGVRKTYRTFGSWALEDAVDAPCFEQDCTEENRKSTRTKPNGNLNTRGKRKSKVLDTVYNKACQLPYNATKFRSNFLFEMKISFLFISVVWMRLRSYHRNFLDKS